MSQPYIGEIRLAGFNFAPVGWLLCQGQLVSIPENDALFALIGTTYGGDGVNTFGLPDLRGRVPMGYGTPVGRSPYQLGQRGGAETVTLNGNQVGAHSHQLAVQVAAATTAVPAGNTLLATSTPTSEQAYYTYDGSNQVALASSSIAPSTGGQSHSNIQPTLCINYIIATGGIYPSPS